VLGSLTDADDAVQDSWLRLSRALASEVENLGGWLTTIVTRVWLNVLRSRILDECTGAHGEIRKNMRRLPMAAPDPVAVAPHVYSVVYENERVRVLDARGNPGDKTELHSHPDLVAIGVNDCHIRIQLPDGQTVDAQLKPTEVLYLQAQEHAVEILGSGETRMLIIELK